MLAKYTCDYLHNSGEICGNASTRNEECWLYYQVKKWYPCTECEKPTGADCGQCRLHVRGYYSIQYVNRLREKAMKVDSR